MNWLLLNNDGTRAVQFTSMVRFAVDNRSDVLSAPIERGSFASYNKVASPINIRVTLAIQGSPDDYDEALTTLKQFADGLETISLETPEAFYESLNLASYSYRRSNETGALTVDLELVEVIEVDTEISTTQFTRQAVKNPTSASTVDTGRASDNPAAQITIDGSSIWQQNYIAPGVLRPKP